MILSPFPAQQLDISIDFHCQYLCCKYLARTSDEAELKQSMQCKWEVEKEREAEKKGVKESATRETVLNAY